MNNVLSKFRSVRLLAHAKWRRQTGMLSSVTKYSNGLSKPRRDNHVSSLKSLFSDIIMTQKAVGRDVIGNTVGGG